MSQLQNPINAKPSMLVTTISVALDKGVQMLLQTRAERFEQANGQITALSFFRASNTLPAQQIRAQTANKTIAKYCVLAGAAKVLPLHDMART